MSTGASSAKVYVEITSATFNQSTGVTTLVYNRGINVQSGDFYGSNVDYGGWSGYYGSVQLYGSGWYAYTNGISTTVAHNSSKSFYEWCGYTSSSAGYIDSEVSFTWYPTLPTYSISYNANSGSGAPSAQTKTWGTAIKLSTTKPTRTGYTFKGWATTQARANAGTVDYASGANYTSNAAATLYAVWQINTWTVSYNGNGATGGSTASQTKTYGQTLTLRTNGFTRTDYVFKNWNTAANGSGTSYSAGGSYTANAAVTLYAQWYAPYTVSYDANGGTGTVESQVKVYNTALTLRQNAYTREGYEFGLWNTVSNGTGTPYQGGASYTANEAATLYAIWNPYVTYDANGGSGAPEAQLKTFGADLKLTTAVPTRAGFSFRAWNVARDGSGTAYMPASDYTQDAALTLYAIWDATVTFDANGGSGAPAPQTSMDGTVITLPSTAPSWAGHTFLEWNTESDGSGDSYQPGGLYDASDGDVTLYAKWRVDIILSGISATLVDANGAADPLGKYVKVTASYDTTASGSECTYFGVEIDHGGETESEHLSTLGYQGSGTWTFGPYAYTAFDPHGGYAIGSIVASNADGEVDQELRIAATDYHDPRLVEISAFRTDDNLVEDEGGTNLGLEATWQVYQSATQTELASATIAIANLATGRQVATRTFSPVSGTSGFMTRFDVYADPLQWPDDDLTDGELMSASSQYVVTATVSDLYSQEVASAKASRSEVITIAFFTMDFLAGGHGVAIGKPSTRALLDVGMEAGFDQDVSVAGDISAVGNVASEAEVSATDANSVVHNLTEKADAINATQSADGLMSASDKAKLDGIESGAQVNTVTGVKGNVESAYRTGDVNLTPADVGAAEAGHAHTLLSNYYTSRPASANLTATGSGGLITFKATSSMTTGKPPADAHVLHAFWDNTGGWDSQLAIGNGTSPKLYYRSQNSGTWGSWYAAKPASTQLYNNATGTTGTVTLSQTAANFNHMRVYYRASDTSGSPVNSTDIYSPNGKRFSLWTVHTTDAKGFTVRGSMRYISGTSMTVAGQGSVGWYSGNGSWSGTSDTTTSNIYVVRVEGWNE